MCLLHFTIRKISLLVDFWITCVVSSFSQMTPLHVAAEKGDRLDIVKYLCEEGADINIKDCSGVSEIILLIEQSAFCIVHVS